MQVIVEQMNAVKTVIGDGLTVLDDVIFSAVDSFLCKATSDRAVQLYRTGWAIAKRFAKAVWWVVGLMMAAAFFSGVLARHVWDWLNDYVDQCEVVDDPVEMEPEENPMAIAEDPVITPELPAVEVLGPVVEVVVDVPPKPVRRKAKVAKTKKVGQAIAV